jgi:lactobin A/cerein 7B family class IIb bacteriocin
LWLSVIKFLSTKKIKNMNTQELNLANLGLVQLDEHELTKTNGGVVPLVLTAFGMLAGVGLIAYGAGYLYGKLTCD